MRIIKSELGGIIELREPSVWNWEEFTKYYEEILKYSGSHEYEYFWRYFDASEEFQYLVTHAVEQFGVTLSKLTVGEAHKLIFEWAAEINQEANRASSSTAPDKTSSSPWSRPPSDCSNYEVTVANLWASEMSLPDVVQALKLFPQSTLTKIIKAYNWAQRTPEDRYKDWSKQKATEDILANGLPQWDSEVNLNLEALDKASSAKQ